jgi:signal transduction histidine kinase
LARLRLPEDHPVWSAALGASLYVGIATVYILLSGRVAAAFAGSIEQLQTIETIKGYAFVVVTGILFFFISLGWWRTRRQQRQQLIRSERKAVASMFSAALAHDLNNMVMALSGLLESIPADGEHELTELKTSLGPSIESLTSLARRLAASVRTSPVEEPVDVELSEMLGPLVALARKHPSVRMCSVDCRDTPSLRLCLNRDLFEQALLNLIVNAAQAAGVGGRVELKAVCEGETIMIEVHDNGPGVPPDQRAAIFSAGYSTKTEGSGLGLLSVQAFAATCGAKVHLSHSPLGGALFALHIPLARVRASGNAATA